MCVTDVLEKKNTMLMKNISGMIIRDHEKGLSRQDQFLLQKFLKEYHTNAVQINNSKD
jgi:hypothetical protein